MNTFPKAWYANASMLTPVPHNVKCAWSLLQAHSSSRTEAACCKPQDKGEQVRVGFEGLRRSDKAHEHVVGLQRVTLCIEGVCQCAPKRGTLEPKSVGRATRPLSYDGCASAQLDMAKIDPQPCTASAAGREGELKEGCFGAICFRAPDFDCSQPRIFNESVL